MENMDVSPQLKCTSLSVASPTATHIAFLNGARLQIRCLTTFEIIRNIPLPATHDLRNSRISWSPPALPLTQRSRSHSPTAATPPRRSSRPPAARSNRVLVSDEDNTRVYDLRDEKWSAVISNGSGGMGRNVHVDFGANEDEVLVWSDFAACVKIWSLSSGRAVEVRDPKFSGKDGKGWGYRPAVANRKTAVLAVLCRSAGSDVLLLLSSPSYTLLARTELPTIDAAGLKWSRDGRWLAIWDAASAGYKLHIYTADGHLYRTISREVSDEANEWGVEGLGIKSVEWVPGNEWLAVGGWDRRVRILSTRTFAPVVFLDHTAVINVPSASVYTELVDGQGTRTYALTPQPATPPKPVLEKHETGLMKQGISLLSFNADGTLCATRDDSTPSTVWIWDLRSLRPQCICIQYTPVKSLTWHPHDASRLLIQTALDAPTVCIYEAPHPGASLASSTTSSSASTSHPKTQTQPAPQSPAILDLDAHIARPTLTAGSGPAKWSAAWLHTARDKKPLLAVANQHAHVLVWPDGKDQILRFEREDGGDESDDSLYEILTGRKAVVSAAEMEAGFGYTGEEEEGGNERGEEGGDGDGDESMLGAGDVDEGEKKRGRGRGGAGVAEAEARGRSVFEESGLDEMF
ncbi:hypothetical protein IQ07DRAFT_617044 [Pyrenochaeta sp. DS3sAY3a]|nr:hypothetical protein IQ07DRAFT_617044 [Pyrenochaeta sp. DS3sAY3a]